MICPKCEEGDIKKILFKKDKRVGFLCEYCNALWYEGEEITAFSGNGIQSFPRDDKEYTFIDIDEKNNESKSVIYQEFK